MLAGLDPPFDAIEDPSSPPDQPHGCELEHWR